MKNAVLGAGIIKLDSRSDNPLFRQIYDCVRESILEGTLRQGTGLPSSRELASQLGLSRMTVVTAYDQLKAEGYLTSQSGKGTFVSQELPEDRQLVRFRRTAKQTPTPKSKFESTGSYLSSNGKTLLRHSETAQLRNSSTITKESLKPFCPGIPALDEFPIELWAKISRFYWKNFSASDLSYGSPAGYTPLRKSICNYVQNFRGVQCDPDQVMIVSGTQQAIDIASRLCLDPGDEVLFEEPGYRTGRAAIAATGAKIVPMPVDQNGAVIETGIKKSPSAKMAYVTPSHQYPMGVTMSIERRMELITWAQKKRAIIVEDDYDSEYRYAQHPIPSLQGLDQSGRTIYIGSFSKVIFPSLGMGYVIVPRPLRSAFESALATAGRPPSLTDQMIVNDFINEGHFERHLRRMRKIHHQRRTALVESISQYLPNKLEIVGSDAGLHCTARILTNHKDESLARKIEAKGIVMRHLSAYTLSKSSKSNSKLNGLIFGFACATPSQIKSSIRTIAKLF